MIDNPPSSFSLPNTLFQTDGSASSTQLPSTTLFNPTPEYTPGHSTSPWPWMQDFGIFPSADPVVPTPPSDFQWDWNSVDLQGLFGVPKEEEEELSEADRDHL
jgi:hypothetical protein